MIGGRSCQGAGSVLLFDLCNGCMGVFVQLFVKIHIQGLTEIKKKSGWSFFFVYG